MYSYRIKKNLIWASDLHPDPGTGYTGLRHQPSGERRRQNAFIHHALSGRVGESGSSRPLITSHKAWEKRQPREHQVNKDNLHWTRHQTISLSSSLAQWITGWIKLHCSVPPPLSLSNQTKSKAFRMLICSVHRKRRQYVFVSVNVYDKGLTEPSL